MKYVSHERSRGDLFVTVRMRRWWAPWSVYTRTALHVGKNGFFDLFFAEWPRWTWTDSGREFSSKLMMGLVTIAEAEERRLEALTEERPPLRVVGGSK